MQVQVLLGKCMQNASTSTLGQVQVQVFRRRTSTSTFYLKSTESTSTLYLRPSSGRRQDSQP